MHCESLCLDKGNNFGVGAAAFDLKNINIKGPEKMRYEKEKGLPEIFFSF